ncbi:MAG: NAD(P)H-binding protein [Myxococcota bacterium]
MRVAVAGGTGFIGRHVVQALRDADHEVRVLSRRAPASDDEAGLEHVSADLGAGPLPPEALAGCDAVVNLVGIKAPRGSNDFDNAHISAVQNLIEDMRHAGLRRLVHISVAQDPEATGPYAQTKRTGEQRVTQSGLDFTILRPGLVYGVGDDALKNLVRMVWAAPVVPAPAGAHGPLPAVDVRDVALAVVAALSRAETVGETIDVVGPEVLDLRGLVARVAGALELPTFIPAVPAVLARTGAAVMERVMPDPLLSRSQLSMLSRGLPGDPAMAEATLGLTPRRLDADRIREVAQTVSPLLPSVRLVTSRAHRSWLEDTAQTMRAWPLVLALALPLMLALPSVLPTVWTRMALINGSLMVVLALALRGRWTALLRPRATTVGAGLGIAAVLYLGAALFMTGLRLTAPAFALQVETVYQWSELAPLAQRLALLPLIVTGEDLVWRGAITLPLAARFGPLLGCLAAGLLFALAHLTTGPPLLLVAAVAMGTLWSALAIRSRSLVPVVVSHLTWDVLVMFVRPL